MLRLGDLPALYREVGREEAIAIAELGVQVYQAAQDRLMGIWAAQQSAEEGTRAEGWKAQGAAAALESLKGRLAAGDAAAARVAALQAGVDAEVDRRLADATEKQTLHIELKKVAPLQQRISMLEGKEEMIQLLKQQATLLTEKLQSKEDMILELQTTIEKQKTSKSSHAIGKIGESTVLGMIRQSVLPVFPFSRVEDKTGVDHAADFHLWTMPSPNKTVKILIDAKKYKTQIKMIEIKKLQADVDMDDEAHAGLMLSLDSGIHNFNQFEIGTTPKHKMIMYISMEGMDDELKTKTLVWAVRVLTSIAAEGDVEQQKRLILNLEVFLKEIDKSVKEMDGCIRMCAKTLDTMRITREKLYTRISNYRDGTLIESAVDEDTGDIPVVEVGICKGVKPTGAQCGFKSQPGKEYCRRHMP